MMQQRKARSTKLRSHDPRTRLCCTCRLPPRILLQHFPSTSAPMWASVIFADWSRCRVGRIVNQIENACRLPTRIDPAEEPMSRVFGPRLAVAQTILGIKPLSHTLWQVPLSDIPRSRLHHLSFHHQPRPRASPCVHVTFAAREAGRVCC